MSTKHTINRFFYMSIVFYLFSIETVLPMEFKSHFSGAMRIDRNSTWISAEGEIVPETPEKFKKFLDEEGSFILQRVVLNSKGGNVKAGMKLGSIIREKQMVTVVGKSKIEDFSSVEPGECASACVFALAGGVERSVHKESQVGVHQISVDFSKIYGDSTLNTEDLNQSFSLSQQAIGSSIGYFVEMGINPNIVNIMTTKGRAEVRWLDFKDLKSTKIIFNPRAFKNWTVEPYKDGVVAYTKSEDETRQLSVLCSKNELKFSLKLTGSPHEEKFVELMQEIEEAEIAGLEIDKKDFSTTRTKDGAIVSGRWRGKSVDLQSRSTFSLLFKTTGSAADLFSVYNFNEEGFDKSIKLARKNCVSN